MNIKEAFASALKKARSAKQLTQEDFSNVSSRTYISTLERGLKNPTLDKIEDLANVMRMHPLTLITLTYMIQRDNKDTSDLFRVVTEELSRLERL
jgi:transcriptional regulator with XRE-family HTH domain